MGVLQEGGRGAHPPWAACSTLQSGLERQEREMPLATGRTSGDKGPVLQLCSLRA